MRTPFLVLEAACPAATWHASIIVVRRYQKRRTAVDRHDGGFAETQVRLCAPARAIATVLLPVNEVAVLIGITKDFGAVSLLPQLSDPLDGGIIGARRRAVPRWRRNLQRPPLPPTVRFTAVVTEPAVCVAVAAESGYEAALLP